MILLNGCTGIGTGWSCFVPCFKFEEVLEKLFENLEKDVEDFVLQPHYYGHKGEIQEIDDRKYKSFGILEPFVEHDDTHDSSRAAEAQHAEVRLEETLE